MTKYSISSYVADGTTTDFLITWDYLDTSHITVFVNGTNVADAGSGFVSTLINPTTVRVTTELAAAPPNGAVIELRRQTPINTAAVTFNDGSSLNGEDLNKNTSYLLYAMQEALDTVDIAAQDGAQAAQAATEGFRDEAEVFKNQAGASATAAATSETNAAASEAAAAASEAAALVSETNAATSETNAVAAATSASTSETNAAASQTAAAASETNAAASASAAATSETNAAASEAAASAAATSATASFDSFDDRYLGEKASDPVLDNDGNALLTGALYFNSVSNQMKVYTGVAWAVIAVSALGDLADVDTTGATSGDGLVYNGSNWEPGPAGGGMFKGDNGTVGSRAGDIFRVNEQELNTNVTISATENASATGPLAIASGVTLTVTSGGSLAIL